MSKNGLLQKQRATNMAFFNAGLESGRQQIIDMLCLVLHDPEIMGKDTFGRDRLLKVIKGTSAMSIRLSSTMPTDVGANDRRKTDYGEG